MSDLAQRCREILAWRRTGRYEGEALADMAKQWPDTGSEPSPIRNAEDATIREALAYCANLDGGSHSTTPAVADKEA